MPKRKNQMSEYERNLFDNSIERVINTTIRILEHLPVANLSEHVQEDIDINIQDWNDLKKTVVHWWNEARNEAFKKYNDQILTAKPLTAEEGSTSLNIVVKRHIQLLGKMHAIGEANVWYILEQYIGDAFKENMIVLSNAEEIYSIFVDHSGRPDYSNNDYKQSHSYKVNVYKIKRIIQEVLNDK